MRFRTALGAACGVLMALGVSGCDTVDRILAGRPSGDEVEAVPPSGARPGRRPGIEARALVGKSEAELIGLLGQPAGVGRRQTIRAAGVGFVSSVVGGEGTVISRLGHGLEDGQWQRYAS